MWRQDMAVTPYQSIPEKGERNLAGVSQENEEQAETLAGGPSAKKRLRPEGGCLEEQS